MNYKRNSFVFRFIVFDATFNNNSVISWRSDLLVENTGKKHRPASRQTLTHNVVSSTTHLAMNGVRTHNLSVDRH